MRRRLIPVFIAISALVAVAFVIPLALLLRNVARDQALDSARADASALLPVLAVRTDASTVDLAIFATASGTAGRVTVFLGSGEVLGAVTDESPNVQRALSDGISSDAEVVGGEEVVSAVVLSEGRRAAVRVFVPDDQLQRGVRSAWLVLSMVGVFLIGLAVLVADRLSRSVIGPSERLSDAVSRLGAGDMTVRVDLDGPRELADVASDFNEMAERMSAMLIRERELVADLSHRLRTPLTKLRLDVEAIDDPVTAATLNADVEEVARTVDRLINEARQAADVGTKYCCDANQVTEARVGFWSVLADDQGRRWHFAGTDQPATVAVRSSDLEAAVDVLIDNVFSHTPEGTGFDVEVRVEPTWILIAVTDDGPGNATAEEGDLRIERGRSNAGSTGLGLDIARHTVEDVAGRMDISTPPTGGFLVELRFPPAAD